MRTLVVHVGAILGLSSSAAKPLFLSRLWGTRVFAAWGLCQRCWRAYFSPMPIRKVSEDLSREDFGLSGLTVLKWVRNSLTSSS